MPQKSISGIELKDAIASDDILGKEVIDSEGNFIGVVEKVFIDKKKLNFIAISVDKGFLQSGLTIGKDYIEKITDYAVFLNIRVAYEIKGMDVFDKNGSIIGIVSKVDLFENKNSISALQVNSGVFKKNLVISSDLIQTIGYSVLLNVTKQEIKDMKKKEDDAAKEGKKG